MRKWQSHKIVEAEPIVGIGPHSAAVANGESIPLPDNFTARGTPEAGDYLVRYDDGYLSWSPKKVFEEGYHSIQVPGTAP